MRVVKKTLFVLAFTFLFMTLIIYAPSYTSNKVAVALSELLLKSLNLCANNAKDIWYYVLTLFGTFLVCIFDPNSGKNKSSIQFLRLMFKNKTDTWYFRSDFFITIVFGSIFGYIIFSPESTIVALSAGFGWGTAFSRLTNITRKVNNSIDSQNDSLDDFTETNPG